MSLRLHPTSIRQRGFALLIVAMSISILAVLMQVFILRTQKELASARAGRDKVKAQYLAYSAMELTKLFLKVQSQFIDTNPMISNMGFDIGQLLPMLLPLFLGDSKMVETMAGGTIEGLGLKPGDGTGGLESFTSPEGRINLNCAISDANIQQLQANLLALFMDRRYEELFGRTMKDSDSLDRQQQVAAFIDFIDIDQSGLPAAGGDEDSYYKSLSEPYLSKNNMLDSPGEIQLIRGVDDIFMANFARTLTVYGSCKINLCAVEPDNWQVIAAVIMGSAKNPADPVISDPVKLKLLATTIVPQITVLCRDTKQFATAVATPGMASQVVSGALGMSIDSSDDLGGDGISDTQVQGVELDQTKLAGFVTSGSRRYYRLRVFGTAGRIRHLVDAVWDQQAVSPTTGQKGAFVYWREE